MDSNLLRKLPRIDDLLGAETIKAFSNELPYEIIVEEIRKVVDAKREAILEGQVEADENFVAYNNVVAQVVAALNFSKIKSLRRVINGTGVVLHTNLGRAKLSEKAVLAVAEVASGYSTLEYDPIEGKRGSRHTHVEDLIKRITGAEAAMVVNNNAAATMLCLAALGRGKEIIVSRGELVEIGGSFRIPEIMEESGAKLVEVGTTNKTKLSDYENAINEGTGALLKVHTSNYKIIGFTEETSISDLKLLGMKQDLPVIYDMGSGLMLDLSVYGIVEPTVVDGLKEGADVVLFSGDKLLGGPQGGIIIGKKKYIDMMKNHPLARVLRVDKMTLAAMAETFKSYFNIETAKLDIPVISMLTKKEDELVAAAERLKRVIEYKTEGYDVFTSSEKGMVGGGSAPSSLLDNKVVKIRHRAMGTGEIARLLRNGKLPIVTRIHEDYIIVDVRTIDDMEMSEIAERLSEIEKDLK